MPIAECGLRGGSRARFACRRSPSAMAMPPLGAELRQFTEQTVNDRRVLPRGWRVVMPEESLEGSGLERMLRDRGLELVYLPVLDESPDWDHAALDTAAAHLSDYDWIVAASGRAVRNLTRSKSRLLQTIGGSALVVLLVMAAVAINQGMKRVLSASGSPHNVVLVGAGSEESIQRSEVTDNAAGIAEAAVPGIGEELGVRAVSSEIHYMNYLELGGGKRAQAMFRGVTPQALRVHPEVRITDGSFPSAGQLMVGRLAWRKLGIPEADRHRLRPWSRDITKMFELDPPEASPQHEDGLIDVLRGALEVALLLQAKAVTPEHLQSTPIQTAHGDLRQPQHLKRTR